jgi:hypothetical protein
VGGALSSMFSLMGSVVRTGSAPAGGGAKAVDPVLAACTGHMGAGCPPADSLTSPVRMPFVSRVAVVLMSFYDTFCCSIDGLWLAAGANTWRGELLWLLCSGPCRGLVVRA